MKDIQLTPTQMAPNPGGAGAMPKQDKFGWRPIGRPTQFKWIPRTEILIDPHYQRTILNPSVIARVYREFDWIAFGAISVAQRDGKYYVVDGQHRLRGAMQRNDVTDLPCLVFESGSRTEEAAAFVLSNTSRKAVKRLDVFKAALVANDPLSCKLTEILSTHGLRIGPGALPDIECVAALLHMLKSDEKEFTQFIKAIPMICPAGQRAHRHLLTGLWFHWSNVGPLTDQQIRKLASFGPEAICAEMHRDCLRLGKAGDLTWGSTIGKLLKKRSI